MAKLCEQPPCHYHSARAGSARAAANLGGAFTRTLDMLGLGARAEGTAALAGSRNEAMLQRQVGYLLSGFWISRWRKLVLQVLGLPIFLCSCHPQWHCHKLGCTLVACSTHAHRPIYG